MTVEDDAADDDAATVPTVSPAPPDGASGVYSWGTGLLIPTDVTLVGPAMDVWVFQIAQDLTIGSGTNIVLTSGALPQTAIVIDTSAVVQPVQEVASSGLHPARAMDPVQFQ